MCQAADVVEDLKYCHEMIREKPLAAKALAGLFKKEFFHKLAEKNLKDMAAEVRQDAATGGDKLKGRLRKLHDMPEKTILLCCQAAAKGLATDINGHELMCLFDVLFGVTSATAYPKDPELRYEANIVKAMKLVWTRGVQALKHIDFATTSIDSLDITDFVYFSTDINRTAVCHLTGEKKDLMSQRDGSAFTWDVTNDRHCGNAAFVPSENNCVVLAAATMFGVGRHSTPSSPLAICWDDVSASTA